MSVKDLAVRFVVGVMFVVFPFDFTGRHEVQPRVDALFVEETDIVTDLGTEFVQRAIAFVADAFALQEFKERFGDGIVHRCAWPREGLFDAEIRKCFLQLIRDVLAALVGVKKKSLGLAAFFEGVQKDPLDETGRVCV